MVSWQVHTRWGTLILYIGENDDWEERDLLTNGFQCLSKPQLLFPGARQTWIMKITLLENWNMEGMMYKSRGSKSLTWCADIPKFLPWHPCVAIKTTMRYRRNTGRCNEPISLKLTITREKDQHQTCQKQTFFPFLIIILTKEVKEASPNCSFRRVRTQAYLFTGSATIFGQIRHKKVGRLRSRSEDTIHLYFWLLCSDRPTPVAQKDDEPGSKVQRLCV